MLENLLRLFRLFYRCLINFPKFLQIPVRNRDGKVIGHVVDTMRGTVILSSDAAENDQGSPSQDCRFFDK